MFSGAGFPLDVWSRDLLWDFRFTWFALLFTVGNSILKRGQLRGQVSGEMGASGVGLRYFWPTYFWGLEASLRFRASMGQDVAGAPSASTVLALSMPGWAHVSRSVAAFLATVLICNVCSRFDSTARSLRLAGSVPSYAIAIAAGVFVFQVGYFLILYSSALVST